MKKYIFIFLAFCITLNQLGSPRETGFIIDPLDNMPIIRAMPDRFGYAPLEQRGKEYVKFLSPSVKISVGQSSGSGTIIYYEPEKNLAYVASCGHLWNKGTMSEESCKNKKMKCKITIFYKNENKLKTPTTYTADVLFYTYSEKQDTSLVVFTPDWIPTYFPIAPIDYKYNIKSVHSCGCDHSGEVAHYSVKIKEVNNDVVTENNSPRPGRSGGGLFDDNGYYIGTCWGTEYVDGSGLGYFTSLYNIHNFWAKQKGYSFLLEPQAKTIKIIDRSGIKQQYSPDYILMP